MKFSTSKNPLGATIGDCVAHRCIRHANIPPTNYNEGNGSSECGACCGEDFGTQLAEMAITRVHDATLLPLLDAFADRLTHHAVLRRTLGIARDRLNIASPGSGDFLDDFIPEYLD